MDFNTVLNYIGTWTLGSLVLIDLIAATTNAFNGAILASRPDHRRNWTTVGIILIAIFGGIGGGVARDVLLNTIPGALTNPWYLILCLCCSYACPGCHDALVRSTAFDAPLTLWRPSRCRGTPSSARRRRWQRICRFCAVVLIGVVGPTAGRFFIDITSGSYTTAVRQGSVVCGYRGPDQCHLHCFSLALDWR